MYSVSAVGFIHGMMMTGHLQLSSACGWLSRADVSAFTWTERSLTLMCPSW